MGADFLSISYGARGDAKALASEALAMAQAVGHPPTIAHAERFLAQIARAAPPP